MIHKQIKEKLQTQDYKELSKALGYSNQKKFEKTLDEFLQSLSLYEWLNDGYYDLVNPAEEFFMKLSLALEIDKKNIDDALSQAKVYQAEIKRFNLSRIFVNTNFKRKSEPIFALAMCESSRNFSLYQDKDFLFKTKEEILEMISQRVKKHYDSKKGELGIWGKIASYQLHLFDKVYIFDTQGNMLPNEEEVPENRATLELK